MRAVYVPTGEVVEVLGPSSTGTFTRIAHFGSEQFVATGCLRAIEDEPKRTRPEPKPKKHAKPAKADEVTLFLREQVTEDDLRRVCKDVGIDYPARSSLGLVKMQIGNQLRRLMKEGALELSWT